MQHSRFIINGLILFFSMTLIIILTSGKETVTEPKPCGPTPSELQIEHHEMEFYGFIHFSLNTFSNKEWGYGNESPKLFNPKHLDCNQWARVAKEAGMTGLILTAKHHDGFCLWPSEYTDYSVKSSPWKDGKGDVLKEFSEACKNNGIKMGLYLSPWDRHSAVYGTPAYITYYRNQLKEILTHYGEVFEMWFDGANGGSGYYGGANETRKIDNKTYYDWPTTWALVRKLQPKVIRFSDAGPDIRWVGNEKGFAGETNWCLLKADEYYPGSPNHKNLTTGDEDGTKWIPAECDVSIRPGWFYHKKEDKKVKSVEQLMDIYYKSIGRGATLLLNVPPDQNGVIHPTDVERLQEFKTALKNEFPNNLAAGKAAEADNWRGDDPRFAPGNVTDGNKESYWATIDGQKQGTITLNLGEETEVNRIVLQEYIRLGQRVKKFTVETLENGQWVAKTGGTTIGYKRILKFPTTRTSAVRVKIEDSKACPVISNIELYRAPDKITY